MSFDARRPGNEIFFREAQNILGRTRGAVGLDDLVIHGVPIGSEQYR